MQQDNIQAQAEANAQQTQAAAQADEGDLQQFADNLFFTFQMNFL